MTASIRALPLTAGLLLAACSASDESGLPEAAAGHGATPAGMEMRAPDQGTAGVGGLDGASSGAGAEPLRGAGDQPGADSPPQVVVEHAFVVEGTLSAVWVRGDEGAVIVGERDGHGLIFRSDGAELRAETIEPASDTPGQLLAVSGSAQTGIWAVGPGLILQHAPEGWVAQNRDQYLSVSCSGLFVEASSGVWISERNGSFMRFDGERWSNEAAPAGSTLTAVWGSGQATWGATQSGAILRREEGTWQLDAELGERGLHALWGSAPDDVWAVGGAGLVAHFAGDSWRVVEVPAEADLLSVSGTAADDVWIAGGSGSLLHFDGEDWSRVELAGVPSGIALPDDFSGVSAGAAGALWLVGGSTALQLSSVAP